MLTWYKQQPRGVMQTVGSLFRQGQNTVAQQVDFSPVQDIQQQQSQHESQMLTEMRTMTREMASMRREMSKLQNDLRRCEQKHTVSEENELLRQQLYDLQKKREQSVRIKQDPSLSEENDALHKEVHSLRNECEQLRQDKQQLQCENARYVDILTNSTSDHVMDQEVSDRLKALRSAVYAAVIEVWIPKFKKLQPQVTEEHQRILQGILRKGPFNAARFQSHVCRVILQVLIKCIFNRSLFSCYDIKSPVAEILKDLEKYFIDIVPQDDWKDVTQWRLATMKCSSYYEPEENAPAYEAERILWRRIGPIFQDDARAEGLAKERIRKICSDALELKLLMRKATDEFAVRDFPGEPVTGVADSVIKFGGEPCGTDDVPGTVAFSRFGALLKFPIGRGDDEPEVLEKAQSVVYV
ncbi:uncharacterized protein PG986_011062 [Apiospora aurea]|uniref:Uncharacterized protein n=1 Tax=Apiospora aurea TaxID=335848 RepID=A0ABR1Q403_9PEZI